VRWKRATSLLNIKTQKIELAPAIEVSFVAIPTSPRSCRVLTIKAQIAFARPRPNLQDLKLGGERFMTKQRHQNGWVTKKAGKYYGHYYVYVPNLETGKDERFHRSNVIGRVSEMLKWEATAKNREIINSTLGVQQKSKPDPKLSKTPKDPTPIMEIGQLAALFAAVVDPMDKCLFAIGVFCALRTAEVFGLIWSSYLIDQFRLSSTAWHHELYRDNAKTQPSRNPIPNPKLIRPYIVEWQSLCPDTSPDALIFPYTPKWGQYKGQVVPWDSYHFMSTRILPFALKLGIPANLVNFQVFRRTAMTELQDYGTIKDVQTLALSLRNVSPSATLKYYIQPISTNFGGRFSDILTKLAKVS
jgi:integrase